MKVRQVPAVAALFVLGMASIASAASSRASSVTANPAQVNLSPTAPTALLSLRNESGRPLAVQLSAFRWRQAEHEEIQLTPTDDVSVSPAVVKLAPGEERQIQIAAGTTFGPTEKTYRLAVQELLDAIEAGNPPAVLTRTTIPVFLEASRQFKVAAVHGIRVEGDHLSLNVENQGAAHFVVDSVVVHGLAQDGESLFDREVSGGYVLAGRVRTYDLPLPEVGCAEMAAITLEIRIGTNVLRETVDAASLMCTR